MQMGHHHIVYSNGSSDHDIANQPASCRDCLYNPYTGINPCLVTSFDLATALGLKA